MKKSTITAILFGIVAGVLILTVISASIYVYYRHSNQQQGNEIKDQVITEAVDTTQHIKTISNSEIGVFVAYNKDIFELEYNNQSNDPVIEFSSSFGGASIGRAMMESFNDLASAGLNSSLPLDQMMRVTRFDHSGYAGYKRWEWRIETPSRTSILIYRIHRDNSVLEISCWASEEESRDEKLETVEEACDGLVRGLRVFEFTYPEESEVQTTEVEVQQMLYVDRGLFLREPPESTSVERQETAGSLEKVENNNLDVTLYFDRKIFTQVSNHDSQEWGGPEINFSGQGVTGMVWRAGEFIPFYLLNPYPWTLPLENMMTVTRFDHSGYAGYRKWSWLVLNAHPSMVLEYGFHRGDDAIEIRAFIDATDPKSEQFKNMEQAMDTLVRDLEFHDARKGEIIEIQQKLNPAITVY